MRSRFRRSLEQSIEDAPVDRFRHEPAAALLTLMERMGVVALEQPSRGRAAASAFGRCGCPRASRARLPEELSSLCGRLQAVRTRRPPATEILFEPRGNCERDILPPGRRNYLKADRQDAITSATDDDGRPA